MGSRLCSFPFGGDAGDSPSPADKHGHRYPGVRLLVVVAALLFTTPIAAFSGTEGADCAACHRKVVSGGQVHDPVSAGDCGACHAPVPGTAHPGGKGGMGLVAKGGKLCNLCHQDMAAGKFVHAPVAAGDCDICHDPHRSSGRALLRKGVSELCRDCHEEKYKYAFTHGQAKQGDCLACHDPHRSATRHLLKQEQSLLCRSCHGKTRTEGNSIHMPVAAGDCTACHDPHGSAYRKNLKKQFSSAFYLPYSGESYALCFGCHDAQLTLDSLSESSTNFRNGRRNLHAIHVNRPDKGRSCKACHDPHGSVQELLIRKKIPGFGAWAIPITYTKTDNGGSCLVGCHKPRSYSRVTEVQYN